MKLTSVVSIALSSVAVNAVDLRRAVVNNNCGRAVAGTAKGTAFQSTARADCSANVVSSYSTVYITPTATTTTTLTTQAIALLSTTTVGVQSTTATSVASQTQTILATYTPVVSSTATVTVTSGTGATVTIYTPTAANPIAKRALEERAASSIPAYASPCTAFTDYVAACSAAGVYGIATISSTLPASIVYITATATSSSTNIIVGTSSTTATAFATIINTLSITSTLTADPSTLVSTQTVAVAPAAQTVTVPMPKFKIKMTPFKAGDPTLYMQRDPGDEQGLPYTTDASQATTWTIDIANNLITSDSNQIVTFYNDLGDDMYYFNGYSISTYKQYEQPYFTPQTCSISPGNLALVCSNGNTPIGYLLYTKYGKWMHYSLAAGPSNNPDYPAYSATIVPV